MFVSRTYKVSGQDAFTLFLNVDFEKGNRLHASIPLEFLRTHIPKVKQVQFYYLPEKNMAVELLDELAERIKRLSNSCQFFYPEYILCDGVISEERATFILQGFEKLSVWPRTHYCQFNKPVDFFVLNSLYIAERYLYYCSMRDMWLDDFKAYLTNPEMKLDFNRLYKQGSKACQVIEDNELRYAMLVSKTEELLMVISI